MVKRLQIPKPEIIENSSTGAYISFSIRMNGAQVGPHGIPTRAFAEEMAAAVEQAYRLGMRDMKDRIINAAYEHDGVRVGNYSSPLVD